MTIIDSATIKIEDADGNEEATCTWSEFKDANPDEWQDVARQWERGNSHALAGFSFVIVTH